MKVIKSFVAILMTSLVVGCSTLNSDFSCNATAIDRCMTIDEVNAMTEGKTKGERVRKPIQPTQYSNSYSNKKTRIWIAPWTDSKGVRHQGELVYAPVKSNEQTA